MGVGGSWRGVGSSPTLIPATERRNADLNYDPAEGANRHLSRSSRSHRCTAPVHLRPQMILDGRVERSLRSEPMFHVGRAMRFARRGRGCAFVGYCRRPGAGAELGGEISPPDHKNIVGVVDGYEGWVCAWSSTSRAVLRVSRSPRSPRAPRETAAQRWLDAHVHIPRLAPLARDDRGPSASPHPRISATSIPSSSGTRPISRIRPD